MSSSSQVLPDAYQACLNESFRQSPLLMERWCASLVERLYERSLQVPDVTEKRRLQNAIAALKQNQLTLVQGFASELTKAIAEDTRPGLLKKSDGATRSFSSMSFGELELMGDQQVQQAVDSARLQQTVALACEAGLSGFSARLSTVQGFKVVKSDRNPLRPEIVSQALLRLLQSLPVGSDARTLWLIHGAQPMGDELQSLYVLLDDLLAGQGVALAAYGVLASPESHREKSGRSAPTAAVPAETGRESVLTLDHLRHLLAGNYDGYFKGRSLAADHALEPSVYPDFAHTLPAALDVLAELDIKRPPTTSAKATGLAAPQPLAQLREHLKTGAKSLGQSLAVEVVRLMIEQMTQDRRLLLAVRQVIAETEPAFLRLGLTDPRFFSDKSHPARRLLDVITSASLAYASENAAGFSGFMENLRAVAALLTEEHASDARHFAALLEDFEHKQASYNREARESQNRAVQALLQAEQRNLLAEKIAAEIRGRADFVPGNRIITNFLTGPWAQVMAKERLLGEHGGLGASKAVFSLTLGDVLWSLNLAQIASHRKRFLKVVPDMLASLREGLLSIDYPLADSRPFFDELMKTHQAALRGTPQAHEDLSRGHHHLEETFAAGDLAGMTQPWLAPSEAQHSGFMDDWVAQSQSSFESTQLQLHEDADPIPAAPPAADASPALQLGDWVELLVDMQWLRAQLTWVSPYNTLYMFTSKGGRQHSMTSGVLQQLLVMQLVKVISQQGVLEGALDGVARTAMRNSLEGSGS
nr:DUF1631 family protein [Polaromonas sp. OV174]